MQFMMTSDLSDSVDDSKFFLNPCDEHQHELPEDFMEYLWLVTSSSKTVELHLKW